jgi:hypothetical protein
LFEVMEAKVLLSAVSATSVAGVQAEAQPRFSLAGSLAVPLFLARGHTVTFTGSGQLHSTGKVHMTGFYWANFNQISGGTVILTAKTGTIDLQLGHSTQGSRVPIPFTIELGTGAFALVSGHGNVTFVNSKRGAIAKFSN